MKKEEKINCASIVRAYLEEHGFDGLAGNSCGCGIDDLMVCDEDFSACVPAYKHKVDCEHCDSECDLPFENLDSDCYKSSKPSGV